MDTIACIMLRNNRATHPNGQMQSHHCGSEGSGSDRISCASKASFWSPVITKYASSLIPVTLT